MKDRSTGKRTRTEVARPTVGAQPVVRRGERGFTILELMASSAVFLVGMAGIVGLHTQVSAFNALNGDLSLASNLASSALEELKLVDYETLADRSTCPAIAVTDLSCFFNKIGAEVADPADLYFRREWTSTTDPLQEVKDIVVKVYWDPSLKGGNDGVTKTAKSKVITMRGRVYPR